MKKLVCSILLVTTVNMFLFGSFAFGEQMKEDEFYDGKDKGEMTASTKHKTTGYIVGGVITGGLLGLIGTGLGIGIIAISSPPNVPPEIKDEVKSEIQEPSKSYKNGFTEGYRKKAKNKNLLHFLYSGLVGSLIGGIIVASQSNK